jgi:hypothetical protein
MRKLNPKKDDEDRTYILPSVRLLPPATTSVPLQDRDPPGPQYRESQGPTLPCQGVTEIVTNSPKSAYPVLVT